MYDVVIVGGGPAGLICARELERLGESSIVLEEHRVIGEPVSCAGLLSISGLKRIGIGEGDYILNRVRGARFVSRGGVAEIGGREDKAYVVDRAEFDRFIAREYGGGIATGERVEGIRKKEGRYSVKARKEYEGEHVVIATGCDNVLQKQLGFNAVRSYIKTIQYEIEGSHIDEGFVEVYLGSVAPGFFGWIIPAGERIRVGLGIMHAKGSAADYMKGFLKRLKEEKRLLGNSRVVGKNGGVIPVFDPDMKLESGGAYLVGDAAGQVKMTTGGGIIMGGSAARILARVIHEKGDYEGELKAITRELKLHLLIRQVINKFGDEEYDHMVEFLKRPEIREFLEKKGDMDLAGPMIQTIISNPTVLMQVINFVSGVRAVGGLGKLFKL